MSKCDFFVKIGPIEALKLIKQEEGADLLEEDIKDLGKGKYIGILVYERYFYRVGNRVSLVIIIDNIYGGTRVKAIGSGGGQGILANDDWGAAASFAFEIKDILEQYVI